MSASGLTLEKPHSVAPQRVILVYPCCTGDTVNVNREVNVYQVAFIPVLQKLNGDGLAKLEKCTLFKRQPRSNKKAWRNFSLSGVKFATQNLNLQEAGLNRSSKFPPFLAY